MSQLLKLSSFLFVMFFSVAAHAELVIIGHTSYKGGPLDSTSVKKIFLGERRAFPDGEKATPANHAVGSPDRKLFFDAVLAMGESAHKRHWTRMLSTGQGTSPRELSSYEEVLEWVAQNPGSIAYIDSRMVNDSVKVLLKVEDFGKIAQADNF